MPSLLDALAARSQAVAGALQGLDDDGLQQPSLLPGWSRLTIACHLRFGARTLQRMTDDALAGRPAAFYPDGRTAQRDTTLRPDPGEDATAVVASLAAESQQLQARWEALVGEEWTTPVREPAANADLGTSPLTRLALLRLTEVEVHGSDLGVGLPAWSDTFVDLALPFRLWWLAVRRPPGGAEGVSGAWTFQATDHALSAHVTLHEGVAECAFSVDPPAPASDDRQAVIRGSRRDLLALLLGRELDRRLEIDGDRDHAAAFKRAFPGP